jgi:hypothetical protein
MCASPSRTSSAPSTPILGSPFSQPVTVRDYLIVSIGDSYGSGEGNPDVPQKFAKVPSAYRRSWVQARPRWEDARCHRSATAGPAQAALRLEATDTHSSVTFMSFACSGANPAARAQQRESVRSMHPFHPGVVDSGVGVLAPYAGAEAPSANDPTPNRKLDDQITQVEHAVGTRHIDSLVMSGGGNDVGFANLGTLCVLTFDCTTRNVTNLSHTGLEPIGDRVNEDLSFLDSVRPTGGAVEHGRTGNQLHVGNYVSEYPDPTRSDGIAPCWNVLGDVIPLTTVVSAGPAARPDHRRLPSDGAALDAGICWRRSRGRDPAVRDLVRRSGVGRRPPPCRPAARGPTTASITPSATPSRNTPATSCRGTSWVGSRPTSKEPGASRTASATATAPGRAGSARPPTRRTSRAPTRP